MKGSSGAILSARGDFVTKTCSDAKYQVEWFGLVSELGLPLGVGTPEVSLTSDKAYLMEFIEGHEATREASLFAIKLMVETCEVFSKHRQRTSGDWGAYLHRLEDHVKQGDSRVMREALKLVERSKPLPSTFCHGDLTLENVLVSGCGIILIDPNFKPGLFQSYFLDLGKILQSTHAHYHRIFGSHHGVKLARHAIWVEAKLKDTTEWRQAAIAAVSHIIRLKKYQPQGKKLLVDDCLSTFIKEHL